MKQPLVSTVGGDQLVVLSRSLSSEQRTVKRGYQVVEMIDMV